MPINGYTGHSTGDGPDGDVVQMARDEVVENDQPVRVIKELLLRRRYWKVATRTQQLETIAVKNNVSDRCWGVLDAECLREVFVDDNVNHRIDDRHRAGFHANALAP